MLEAEMFILSSSTMHSGPSMRMLKKSFLAFRFEFKNEFNASMLSLTKNKQIFCLFINIKQPFFKRKQIVDGIPSFQINSFQAFYFFWNDWAPVISHQQDK